MRVIMFATIVNIHNSVYQCSNHACIVGSEA